MRNIGIACITALLLIVSSGAVARGYGHHGYGHHGYSHHSGSHAGFLVGGLVLGALLAQPRYFPPRYTFPPRVVYVPQPVALANAPRGAYQQTTQTPVARRLLRDIHGKCFERKIDSAGTELRIELPAGECAW